MHIDLDIEGGICEEFLLRDAKTMQGVTRESSSAWCSILEYSNPLQGRQRQKHKRNMIDALMWEIRANIQDEYDYIDRVRSPAKLHQKLPQNHWQLFHNLFLATFPAWDNFTSICPIIMHNKVTHVKWGPDICHWDSRFSQLNFCPLNWAVSYTHLTLPTIYSV